MEGWLQKKSSGLSFGFSKKYFKLENFTLQCLTGPTDRSTKEAIDLRTCTSVADVPKTPSDPSADYDFQLVYGSKKKVLLRASNADEKACWLRLLQPFNNAASITASGGSLPIANVLQTGLFTCIDALSRDGCVQGIFRESGRAEEVKAIFMAFVRGSQQLPMGADVHAVAGALKKFLREMPETLFTNKLFEQVVAPNPNPTRLGAFVAALPPVNREILTALTELLYLIVCHSNVTRMDVKNLAIVLTPNVTRKDQPGVIVPIEPFWAILINNKDTVLYGEAPAAVASSPAVMKSSTPVSKPAQAPSTPSVSRSTAATPTPTSHVAASSTKPPSTKPAPLTIPTNKDDLSLQTMSVNSTISPRSEPAHSPSVAYHQQPASTQAASKQQPPQPVSASAPPVKTNPTQHASIDDSLMTGDDEDLDSLFPSEAPPTSTKPAVKSTTTPSTSASAAPAVTMHVPTASTTTKPASTATAAPRPNAHRSATLPPRTGGGVAPPGSRRFDSDEDEEDEKKLSVRAERNLGRKKPSDEDEMDLFEESHEDLGGKMTQAQKNAEAIRKAREARGQKAAAAPSAKAPDSPPAPAPKILDKSAVLSSKDAFGFEDETTMGDATAALLNDTTAERSPKAAHRGGGGGGATNSLEIDTTVDGSTLNFDSPPAKGRAIEKKPVTAAAAPPATTQPPAKAPTAATAPPTKQSVTKPPAPILDPQDSLLNSSFSDDTLGSTLLTDLDMTADASIREPVTKKPTQPAPAPAQVKSTPAAVKPAAVTKPPAPVVTSSPPRPTRTVNAPLSAVKESAHPKDEESSEGLSLSLDDSLIQEEKALGKNSKSIAIAAAAAKARAAKAAGINLRDLQDDSLSISLDSQLASPPPKKVAPVATASAKSAVPPTNAPNQTTKAAVAPPAKTTSNKVVPPSLDDDNTLDLMSSMIDDTGMSLLSDMSELPPIKKTVAPTPATAAKSASAAPAAAKSASTASSKSEAVTAAPASTATNDSNSVELARLLREVRRLELENLALTSQVSSSTDALRDMTYRAEDAEKRLQDLSLAQSAVSASTNDEVKQAIAKAEKQAEKQVERLKTRFQEELRLVTQRTEAAEQQALAHLTAKDMAEGKRLEAMELQQQYQLKLDSALSTSKTIEKERAYLKSELDKRDDQLREKRQALLQLQSQFDGFKKDHLITISAEQGSSSKLTKELELTSEKLRRMTAEREEWCLKATMTAHKVETLEKELQAAASSTSATSPDGVPALLSAKFERERIEKLHEHDRNTWNGQKQALETRANTAEERYRQLLQQYTDLEAKYHALSDKLERATLSGLSAQQKISYLSQAISAIEIDYQKKLRGVVIALIQKTLVVESYDTRMPQAENLLEKYVPSDVYESYQSQRSSELSSLQDRSRAIQNELSTSTTSASLITVLERFPTLRNLSSLVSYASMFPESTIASGSTASTARSPPAQDPTLAPLTSRAYRSSTEFIPLTSATNQNGVFTHRSGSNGNKSQEEKSQVAINGKDEPASARSSSFQPFQSYGSSYVTTPSFTHSSAFTPSSQLASSPSTSSTAYSPASSRIGLTTARPSPQHHQRVNFEESKRQLMHIEAKTRAGLDASHQRLQAIEQSLAVAQAQAQQQLEQLSPRKR